MSDIESDDDSLDPKPGFRLDPNAHTAIRDLATWIGFAGYAAWFGAGVALVASFFGGSHVNAAAMWAGRVGVTALNAWLGWWFIRIRDAFANDGESAVDGHRALMHGLAALDRYLTFHKYLAIGAGILFGMVLALAAFLLLVGR